MDQRRLGIAETEDEEVLVLKQPRTKSALPEKPKVLLPPHSPTNSLPSLNPTSHTPSNSHSLRPRARPSLLSSLQGKGGIAPRVFGKEEKEKKVKGNERINGGKDIVEVAVRSDLLDQKQKKEADLVMKAMKNKKVSLLSPGGYKGGSVKLVDASPPPINTTKKKGFLDIRKSVKTGKKGKAGKGEHPPFPILDIASPDLAGPEPLMPLTTFGTPAPPVDIPICTAIIPPSPAVHIVHLPPAPIPAPVLDSPLPPELSHNPVFTLLPPTLKPAPAAEAITVVTPPDPIPVIPDPPIIDHIHETLTPKTPSETILAPTLPESVCPSPSPVPAPSSPIPTLPVTPIPPATPIPPPPSTSTPPPPVIVETSASPLPSHTPPPPAGDPPVTPPSPQPERPVRVQERPLSVLLALGRAEEISPPKKRGSEKIFNALEKAKRKLTRKRLPNASIQGPLPEKPPRLPSVDLTAYAVEIPVPSEFSEADPALNIPEFEVVGLNVLELEAPEFQPADLVELEVSKCVDGEYGDPEFIPLEADNIPETVLLEQEILEEGEELPEVEDQGVPEFGVEFREIPESELGVEVPFEVPVEVLQDTVHASPFSQDSQPAAGAHAEDGTYESCDNAYEDMPSAKQKVKGQPTKKKKGSAKSKTQAPYNPYAETQLPTEETLKTGWFLKKPASETPDEKELKKKEKQRLEKEKKEQKERERKEQKEREKKENEMKKFKITGQKEAIYQATVMVASKGRKNDLAVKNRDIVSIIRTTNCPKGKWLARDSTNTFTDDSEEWTHDDDEPLSSPIDEEPTESGQIRTMSMPEMGSREPSIHHQHTLSDASIDDIDMQRPEEPETEPEEEPISPMDIEGPETVYLCKEEADLKLPDMVILPPPDLYADIIITGEQKKNGKMRASVVMRLAHISKKSMVWLPWRGVGVEVMRAALEHSDPGREELSWGRSTAGKAESTLSLGLWSPAVEPDLWGVEEPDLNPTASMMSSGEGERSVQDRRGKSFYDQVTQALTGLPARVDIRPACC
ncbi:unnamed protein product [Coregonus sp. 'balchen']|nr:unnamed protein product [Coregonus sp. 'balchen']